MCGSLAPMSSRLLRVAIPLCSIGRLFACSPTRNATRSDGDPPMSSTAQEQYDRVLYPGTVYTQTHPDRLATLAKLFGMSPAPLEHCRILELGCTDGGNLIPMAHGLPGAKCVGIDVSTRALAAGRACIEGVGLTNIRLLDLDILDMPSDFGVFDYIIAHGVYSWVPPAVRERILAICRVHLAPQGVAYISNNVYPGSHIRDLVRGMMRFHVRNIDDPADQRRQATALLRFVVKSQSPPDLFRQLIAAELEWLEKSSDAAFHHDDLAEIRTPFYFHEFIADAARHDLQYLSEAAISEMQEQLFSPEIIAELDAFDGDRIAREQYLDFLKCRRFRQTLLCHREVNVRGPLAEAVPQLFVSSRAKPKSAAPVLDAGVAEEFTAPGNASVTTGDSMVKAALLHLAQIWPRSIEFDELRAAARKTPVKKNISFAEGDARSEFAQALLAMYSAGVIQLHTCAAAFTLALNDRPVVSPVARWFVSKGSSLVPNLQHRSVRLDDPIAAQIVLLLDGTRDRNALVRDLAAFCKARGLIAQVAGSQHSDLAELKKIIESGLEENLRKLALMALLVS